jgi:hypothetical protein
MKLQRLLPATFDLARWLDRHPDGCWVLWERGWGGPRVIAEGSGWWGAARAIWHYRRKSYG